jgi:CDP-glycerol glycerophosphotransferase (TagB/SpsB family)
MALFSHAVEQNHLSQEDANGIIQKFNSLKNVRLSEHTTRSLVDDIMESDIIIADGTSSLAEAVIADKPIIYLSNGLNKEFESAFLSREFRNYLYFAYSPNEIMEHIEYIRSTKYSPFEERFPCKNNMHCSLRKIKRYLTRSTSNRDHFKKTMDPIENPGKFISDYILYDN